MRRIALATGLSLLFLSQAAGAQTKTKDIPSTSLFPFLQTYLALPSASRDHFHMIYLLRAQGARLSDVHMVLKRPSEQVPLSLAASGEITSLPTLNDLTTKAPIAMSAPDGAKFGITLKVAATLPLTVAYDARDLKTSVDQAHAGARKAAGLMAMMVPDFQLACFDGTTSGTATLANGKTIPLKGAAKTDDVKAGTPLLCARRYGRRTEGHARSCADSRLYFRQIVQTF